VWITFKFFVMLRSMCGLHFNFYILLGRILVVRPGINDNYSTKANMRLGHTFCVSLSNYL